MAANTPRWTLLMSKENLYEQDYRTHGFIRPTPATAAAFAQVDECRANLFAPDPAPTIAQRIELRAAIGKLTQKVRKQHLQGVQP